MQFSESQLLIFGLRVQMSIMNFFQKKTQIETSRGKVGLRRANESSSRKYNSSTWMLVTPKPRINSEKTPGSDSIEHQSPADDILDLRKNIYSAFTINHTTYLKV